VGEESGRACHVNEFMAASRVDMIDLEALEHFAVIVEPHSAFSCIENVTLELA